LWTSDFSFENASAWRRLLRKNGGQEIDNWSEGDDYGYLLEPKDKLNVFEIDCMSDYLELQDQFPLQIKDWARDLLANPLEKKLINFKSAANVFDAIRLSAIGCENVPGLTHLHGWDIPSTVWLRWSFQGHAKVMLPKILR
jgi:hypothetical protein